MQISCIKMEGMSSDQSKEVAHTYRATQARTSIIAVLTEGNAPLSVGEILDVLKKNQQLFLFLTSGSIIY